jgi:hypothetical protein
MEQSDTRPGEDVFDAPCDRDQHLVFLDLSAAACPVEEALAWSARAGCEALAAGREFVDAVVLTGETREAFDALPVCYTSPRLRTFTHLRDRARFERLRQAVGAGAPDTGHHAVINRFFAATGVRPYLAAPPATRIWAEGSLKSFNPGTVVATIQAGPDGERAPWEAFLEGARDRYPETVFLVLGPQAGWSARTRHRSDIVFPERQGLGLLERLALLQAGDLFFGLAGGLTGMACFSDLPYVLFLPPREAARFARELDVPADDPALPFAGPRQRLCWAVPNADTLLAAFGQAVASLGDVAGGSVQTESLGSQRHAP